MIERRACPSPTRPWGAIQIFWPSGPRWMIRRVPRSRDSRETGASGEKTPTIPHIAACPPREGRRQVMTKSLSAVPLREAEDHRTRDERLDLWRAALRLEVDQHGFRNVESLGHVAAE